MENTGPDFIGDFSTPDVFADEATFFDLANGTVRITFAVARPDKPVPGANIGFVAIGRLIMPAESAQRLALGLHDYLIKIGLDPSVALTGGQTTQ